MECSVHPETPATTHCASCKTIRCDACLAYDVDGARVCASCGAEAALRSDSIGSALIAFVGVGYLATLALGVLAFRGRPFVGGMAAVVAIALGRALQTVLKRPDVRARG